MYKRYVDDMFLLFRSEHVEKFKNNQHKNIAFISEIGQNGSLQLLKKAVRTTSLLPQFTESLHFVDF